MPPSGKSYSPIRNFKFWTKKIFPASRALYLGHMTSEKIAREIMTSPCKSYSPVRKFKFCTKWEFFLQIEFCIRVI